MISSNRVLWAAALGAVFLVGCKQATPAAADGAGAAGGANAATGGVQTVYVKDPSLNNMNAFAETIPASWHFIGTLYQGGNCVQTPSAVGRASSPDGLSFVEFLPPYGWAWGTGPRLKMLSDCIPVTGPMTADTFLQHLATSMGLQYTGVDPAEAGLNAQAQKQQVAGQTTSLGSILVQSQNGSFTIKGTLTALVNCSETRDPGLHSILQGMPSTPPSDVNKCVAYVEHVSAPAQQFDAVEKLWQTPGLGGHGAEKDWFSAYMKRSTDQWQAVIAAGQAITRASNAESAAEFSQLQARAQQFQVDQQVRQQQHNQFLASMQSATDSSMANSAASMNARSTAASNVVDFALDRQTVIDPGTGQVREVSSAYTSTWVDSSGKSSFQTNDPNANPNGVLAGTWTQQKAVNGNGTPR